MATQPNLLVILTDQQAATMLGCAGNPYVRTPAMDWIAAGGVRFEQAYCTNPVCVPSRFSLVTGRFPSAIGLRHNGLEASDGRAAASCYRQGVGWLLQAAGYEAAYAGKQHLPHGTAEDAGFRVLELDERDGLARTCAEFVQGEHERPFALVASFINPHDICYMALRDCARAENNDAFGAKLVAYAERELACLDEALHLPDGEDRDAFFAAHCPPLPANHAPQDAEPEGIADLLDERPFRRYARTHYSEERWRLHRWAYAKLTERVDREIGVLLDGLRAAGRDRDTVVVFTSDHGDHDAAHQLEHKTAPYREATRIPLLLRPAGGLDAPVVNRSHLVCNGLDLLPTLADYAGAEAPADLEGRSLRPFAEGAPPAAWRDSLCIESQNSVSILTERWQLTRFDRGAHAEQLYDLQADPGQTRNHAADPANGEVLADLRRRLAEREASAGAAPGRPACASDCAPQGQGRSAG